MAYKVDGNPQLDTCDWSVYSNIFECVILQISCLIKFSKLPHLDANLYIMTEIKSTARFHFESVKKHLYNQTENPMIVLLMV